MAGDLQRLSSFNLQPGRRLAGKYEVGELLGKGWEGEVYHVTELATGIERAAKFFFPDKNPNNKSITFYARKLDKLRKCSILIQYHTQETFRYKGNRLPFLVSEYVEGDLLSHYIEQQAGQRLHHFEALHLFHALVAGLEEIHAAGEYHGDIHTDNVIVQRVGLRFELKLLDMYFWGRRTREHVLDDICWAIRVLYDAVGGQPHYRYQPTQIKEICCGLKRTLIGKKFRTATQLRHYLETMRWD